jgi:DNA polymerase III alpha subunit
MRNICPVHCHQNSLDTASTPEAFAKKEVELGTGALACTDHGSMAALYRVYSLAKKNNLTPILGLEWYFRDDNCPILTKAGIQKTNTIPKGSDKVKWAVDHPEGTFIDHVKYMHGTLGYRDYDAYLTGVKLLSKADDRAELHGSERKPLFDWDDLEALAAKNTTLGSGCLVGMISRHLISDKGTNQEKVEIAKAYFERIYSMWGDRFFVELFPHVCSHNYVKGIFIQTEKETLRYYFGKKLKTDLGFEGSAEDLFFLKGNIDHTLIGVKNFHTWVDLEPSKIVKVWKEDGFVQNECTPWAPGGDLQFGANAFMMSMAKKYNVPILVSDDSHFTDPTQKIVQDIRLSNGSNDWKFWGSYHRQGSEEAFQYFQKQFGIDLKTFEGWVDNSYQWVEGFKGFKFDDTITLPTKFYPQDTLQYTKELIVKKGRMKNDPVYKERLKKEIDWFHRNGTVDLLPYFFIDAVDCCEIYERQEILTGPGRGSAGGTLLAYLLGITHIDPIKYGLSLERFFNPDRLKNRKLPDIDQDLPTRDLLTGMETDIIEFEMADGTKHTLPEWWKVETDLGNLTVKEALEREAEVKTWWRHPAD